MAFSCALFHDQIEGVGSVQVPGLKSPGRRVQVPHGELLPSGRGILVKRSTVLAKAIDVRRGTEPWGNLQELVREREPGGRKAVEAVKKDRQSKQGWVKKVALSFRPFLHNVTGGGAFDLESKSLLCQREEEL